MVKKILERERERFDKIGTMSPCFAVLRWLVWVWALFLHCWDPTEVFRCPVLSTPRQYHTGDQLGEEFHVSLPETNVSLCFRLDATRDGGSFTFLEMCPFLIFRKIDVQFNRSLHFLLALPYRRWCYVSVILIQGSISKPYRVPFNIRLAYLVTWSQNNLYYSYTFINTTVQSYILTLYYINI